MSFRKEVEESTKRTVAKYIKDCKADIVDAVQQTVEHEADAGQIASETVDKIIKEVKNGNT